ncbi:MAG: cytochrome-c peroxidase [Desulfovibrio sp.]|nr:cytochrome-c peroxidase [Desulfovibrio sp.]
MKDGKPLYVAFAMLAGLIFGSGATHVLAASSPAASLKNFSQVAGIIQEKCMACHTLNYELPFYAAIPGIRQIIEKDYNDGIRAINLDEEFGKSASGKPVSEPTLAKMEWVTANETMPPQKFTAVHWGSRVSAQERSAVLDWVKSSRAAHYATGTAAPDKADEPVQPLPDALPTDAKKVALGQKLFQDKRLSGDNAVACATCHPLDKAGMDGLRFAEGIGKQVGGVNAPTVFNAVFNVRQFWDGRAADLREQAGGPPFNPIEMGSKDWEEIIGKLSGDEALTAEFKAVYPEGYTGANIEDAVAEYEKTLITPDNRFDQWLKGKNNAISQTEAAGYERFKAYRCASCHVGKSLGGRSFEYMDLKKDYFADRASSLDSDAGLGGFTKKESELHKFKVPNLRNIELTAPYLHDGTHTTLDKTVETMGIYLAGMEIPQQHRELIVAFLRTLTGTYQGRQFEGRVTPQ